MVKLFSIMSKNNFIFDWLNLHSLICLFLYNNFYYINVFHFF